MHVIYFPKSPLSDVDSIICKLHSEVLSKIITLKGTLVSYLVSLLVSYEFPETPILLTF